MIILEIQGILTTIIFENSENGYIVARIDTDDGELTITGNTGPLSKGTTYKFTGELVYHSRYGEQFAVTNYSEVAPKGKSAIINYLSGGLIPHIGPSMANRIYEYFKEDCLEIIRDNPDRLLEVHGIGKVKLKSIKEALNSQRGVRDLILFLDDYDISVNMAMKIYNTYKENSIEVVKKNPYKISDEVRGFGFKSADKLALSMGIERDSTVRIHSAFKYVLEEALLNGDTYLPEKDLLEKTYPLIDIDMEKLEENLFTFALDPSIFIEKKSDARIYFKYIYKAENYVAGMLKDLAGNYYTQYEKLEEEISEVEEKMGIEFAENQVEAIKTAIENGVCVITGGPGTGKTTTLMGLIHMFEKMDKKVMLCAPSGRAAKRMSMATGRAASTIHKLLEISYVDENPDILVEGEKLKTDVLIIDEMSMVDLNLMNNVLHRIEKSTRLVLVGDANQLPSIGAGNVLGDIIASGRIPTVKLDLIFRQAEKSAIIKNAHYINKGQGPELNGPEGDFFMIHEKNQSRIVETVVELVKTRLPQYYGIDSSDIQVLTPMKKSPIGTINLNNVLQESLNPPRENIPELKYLGQTFRVGDRVMQVRNNYELEYTVGKNIYMERGKGVFNGDLGVIEEIDIKNKTLKVLFDEVKRVEYESKYLDELLLSYATTIHKSQGSEFPLVVIPISWGPPMLYTRNLIYTAITRAKKLVVLVGEYKYLKIMIDNEEVSKRYSSLRGKLNDFYHV